MPTTVSGSRLHRNVKRSPSCTEYTVNLVATDARIPLTSLLGRQAALQITLADGSRIVRSGYVVKAEILESDGGLAAYRVTLAPWLWLATQGAPQPGLPGSHGPADLRGSRRAYSPRLKWRVTPEVDAFLADVRVRQLLRPASGNRCASSSSASWPKKASASSFAELFGADAQKKTDGKGDAASTDLPADIGPEPLNELVIFADSVALPEDYSSLHQNGGRGIRYHRAASQEAQDAIQAFGGLRRLQPAVTTLASLDYKAKSVVTAQLGTHHNSPARP